MAKHSVAKLGEITEGGCKLVYLDKIEVALFLVNGEYRAYRNNCPHAGAPICSFAPGNTVTAEEIMGKSGENPTIRCPWHGWEFSLMTGQHTYSNSKLRDYPVEIEGDEIFVELP